MILYYCCRKNKMHVYILTNENNDYEWNYIQGDEIINSQIIIKKNFEKIIFKKITSPNPKNVKLPLESLKPPARNLYSNQPS